MHSFIPHKNNPHTFRKTFFVVLVVCVSGGLAYFIEKYPQKKEIEIPSGQVQNQIVENEEVLAVTETEQAEIAETEDKKQTEETAEENITEEKKEENTGGENDIALKLTAKPLTSSERNKNPATRLQEAMVYAQPQILTGKYIDVSLAYQNIVIFENGKPLKAFLISSGVRGLYTPIGTFKIENKHPRAWSKNYGLWMPYWMAFLPSGEMGIHELPEWPGGYKEGANHLGTPASHGCIRLGMGSAKELYDWAEIGTPVVIHK
ncbi:MAG TPA: L,D-transpeptidase family protein [Candidatus Moranbacteria bacterium]|nr:L,D-transpeptidase family protein [Candidatus Moranbacteria bacterium]